MSGEIVNPAMIDTLSVIGPTGYYPLPIGGVIYTCDTIKTSLGAPDPEVPLPVIIMDPDESPGTHPFVPGTPIPPYPGPPAPLIIERPALLPVQNKSVFFEGKLVAVAGDHMTAVPATVPPTRPIIQNQLTSPTIYPTIKIGTQVPIS